MHSVQFGASVASSLECALVLLMRNVDRLDARD